jgi:hypothetical protein
VTLVELLVTMMVIAMVAAVSAQATIMIARSITEARAFAASVAAVRLGLGSMERQIRSGDVLFNPVSEATITPECVAFGASAGSCMRVYTQVNGTKRCVQWQVIPDPNQDGRAVMRSRSFSPSWATDGEIGDWRTVATGLLPPTATQAPFTLSDAASAYSTRLLEVKLIAVDAARPARTSTVTTALSGRGTVYGGDRSLCSPGPA